MTPERSASERMTSELSASERNTSMQQLNPLGSAGSWELAVVLGFATLSYVLLSSVANQANTPHPFQMLLAVLFISVAVIVNMVASSPRNREYRRNDFVFVVGMALGAAVLQSSASTGEVASIATDWGPLAFAGVLAAAGSFRPKNDLLWAGLLGAGIVALQKTLEGLSAELPFGLVYFVANAIAPIVIITLGQGAYTGYAMRSLKAWQRGIQQTQQDVTSFAGRGEASRISQEFLTEFGAGVQPIFTRILNTGRITERDSRAAAGVAERIRRRLVAIAQQTWLERLAIKVVDPERIAERLDAPSRAAVTALVSGLNAHAVTELTVRVSEAPGKTRITLHISGAHGQSRLLLRTQLAPIFRVLYVVFYNVTSVFGATTVTVQFDYGVE